MEQRCYPTKSSAAVMKDRAQPIAMLGAFLLALSCAGGSEPPQRSGVGVFFAVHGERDAPSGQGFGMLSEEGGCLVVTDPEGFGSLLPAWPEGLRYADGVLLRDGSVVAEIGDDVELEGGEISSSVFETITGAVIPPNCASSTPFMVADVKLNPR